MDSNMKDPIERLRIAAHGDAIGCMPDLNGLADEIQAMIDREYIKLPVDADGVPIRPGDMLIHSSGNDAAKRKVAGVGSSEIFIGVMTGVNPKVYRHIKPNIVEVLLAEYVIRRDSLENAIDIPGSDMTLGDLEEAERNLLADYADRIRKTVDGNGHQDHLWVSTEEYNGLVDAAGECQKWRDECKKLGEQLDRLRNDGRLA